MASSMQIVVRAILVKDNHVLLLKRTSLKGGGYSFAGGHVERRESPIDALVRETYEEIGVRLDPVELKLHKVVFRGKGPLGKIHLFFWSESWEGKPKNREPRYCKDLEWFDLAELPVKLSPAARVALEGAQKGSIYIEMDSKITFPFNL